MMIKAFQDLGDAVAMRWERSNHFENDFTEIAVAELEHSKALLSLEPKEIVSWLMSSKNIPAQDAKDFGQPPVNVYVTDEFLIQVIFWIDGTTAIHEHAFLGAFGVLHGSSVQSTYSFTPERTASERLVVGRTKFLSSEILQRGEVRPIHSGDRLIHALFHLDRPSVSVVIRTTRKVDRLRPQYVYVKPYLAIYNQDLPKLMVTQIRMLQSLSRTDVTEFWHAAKQISSNCDPFMLYQILCVAYGHSSDDENWNGLLAAARECNAWVVDYILPCLKEEQRASKIRSLRASVHDPRHRLFLGLLLNVPTREELYRLIAQHFPNDAPRTLVVQWLSDIFSDGKAGLKLTPPLLVVLDRLLRGEDFECSRAILREQFRSDQAVDEQTLERVWVKLKSMEVLQPLMTVASAAE